MYRFKTYPFLEDKENNIYTNIINYYGSVDQVLGILEPSHYIRNIEYQKQKENKEIKVLEDLLNLNATDNPVLIFYNFKDSIL